MDTAIKKIPYGMTDFESIICDNYYYVDKTHFIALIEKTSRFFFFVRPRRFGKSLLLSTIEAYLSGKKELFKGHCPLRSWNRNGKNILSCIWI